VLKERNDIIDTLRKKGCRITKQRLLILDIILADECCCCKEIYYKAAKQDSSIGAATVYRMINTLEDIGALSRSNTYKLSCGNPNCSFRDACIIEFNENRKLNLSGGEYNKVIKAGLVTLGYMKEEDKINGIYSTPCPDK